MTNQKSADQSPNVGFMIQFNEGPPTFDEKKKIERALAEVSTTWPEPNQLRINVDIGPAVAEELLRLASSTSVSIESVTTSDGQTHEAYPANQGMSLGSKKSQPSTHLPSMAANRPAGD